MAALSPRGPATYALAFDGVVYWTGEETMDWYLKTGAVAL